MNVNFKCHKINIFTAFVRIIINLSFICSLRIIVFNSFINLKTFYVQSIYSTQSKNSQGSWHSSGALWMSSNQWGLTALYATGSFVRQCLCTRPSNRLSGNGYSLVILFKSSFVNQITPTQIQCLSKVLNVIS